MTPRHCKACGKPFEQEDGWFDWACSSWFCMTCYEKHNAFLHREADNPLTYCLNCGRVLKPSSEGMFCDETCRLLWKTGRGGRDE